MNSVLTRLAPILLIPIATAAGSAQERPIYAGEWVRVADTVAATRPSVAPTGDARFRLGDMGSGWGSTLTITQTADSLVVEYPYFSTYDLQPRLHLAYALSGAESRNDVMIGHATTAQRSRISWEGATLVITTTWPTPASLPNGGGSTVRHALTLASSNQLIIETTRGTGGNLNTVRSTYSRK